MAKDPAVLFYYQDFLVGTSFMTETQVGAYIRILCHLYDKDHLTEKHMQSICSASVIWDSIKDKFDIDPDGSYYHKRAREEKKKRVKFTESRRLNALKTTSDGKHMHSISKASAKHMEDEDEDENINVINHENGVENKKSPEGIMFRCWNKKCKNLEESRQLQLLWIDAGEDPETLEFAFRQSVKYNKSSFAYVEGVCKGVKADKDRAAAIKREEKAHAEKIENAKTFVPDPETAKVIREVINKLAPGKKVDEKTEPMSLEQKLERKRKTDKFNQAIREGK